MRQCPQYVTFLLVCLSFLVSMCLSVVELEELLLVLFAAKQIFPLPGFLREEGVDVYAFDLCAGELLYVAGDWVQFGFNQAPHSVSLTTNLLSEAWLKVRNNLTQQ